MPLPATLGHEDGDYVIVDAVACEYLYIRRAYKMGRVDVFVRMKNGRRWRFIGAV
jgi:hypothetical protein